MKNRLLSLLLISLSFGYCFGALPLRVSRIEQQAANCAEVPVGELRIFIEGGTPPYFYTVNDDPTVIQVLDNPLVYTNVPGSYAFAIADSAEPFGQTSAIAQIRPHQPLEITALRIQNNDCSNQSIGAITVETQGGIPPIQIALQGVTPFTNSNTFTNLPSAGYTIVARDQSGCPNVNSFVTLQPPPVVFAVIPTNVTCNGGSNGIIEVDVNGGVGPFQFSIDNGVTFQASNRFTGLRAGNYLVVVRDANGCTYFVGAQVITQPTAFSIQLQVTNVTAPGLNNGRILVIPSIQDPAIVYDLAGPSSRPPQSSPLFTNLAPGTYTVTAVRGLDCAIATATIAEAGTLDFTTTILTQPQCPTGLLGSLRVNATGGIPPYQYSIDNGATFQSSPVFTGLVAGTYTIVVRDSVNNRVSHTVLVGTVIRAPADPLVNFILRKFCKRCVVVIP